MARRNPSEGGDRGGLETRVASANFGSRDKMAHLAIINLRRRTNNNSNNNNNNFTTYIALFTYSDQKRFTCITKSKIMLSYICTKTSYNQ